MSGSTADVRVLIFIDYWNFASSLKEEDSGFQSDWKCVAPTIMRAVQALDQSLPPRRYIYQGMRVIGSYDPTTEAGKKSKNWAVNFLSTKVPGCTINFVERQKKKSGPGCPACHETVTQCPKCKSDMRGTEEKGVDTRIATEMISQAWEDAYDVAVVVSADRDFAPVIEFIQTKGKNVIHAGFPPKGALLRQVSWGHINLAAKLNDLRKS